MFKLEIQGFNAEDIKAKLSEALKAFGQPITTPVVEAKPGEVKKESDADAGEETERGRVKAALDQLGVKYTPNQRTKYLQELLAREEAKARAALEPKAAKPVVEHVETVRADLKNPIDTEEAPVEEAPVEEAEAPIEESVTDVAALKAEAKTEEPAVTVEVVRELMKNYAAKNGVDKMKKLLDKYGVPNLSTLKPDQLADLHSILVPVKPKTKAESSMFE